VTKTRTPRSTSLSVLLSELRSFGERTGDVIGGAYALAARSLLTRVERLEDLSAERRYTQRVQSAAPKRPNAAARRLPPSLPLPSK
jgi:hypothetical protein